MKTIDVRSKPKRQYRSAAETRNRVLGVAGRLFYCQGIRAVGIDRLAAETGVTTATLYRLFGSKEGLIIAYLKQADDEWFNWFDSVVNEGGLSKLFDELEAHVGCEPYRGCAFRMAMIEYPDPDSEIHRVALENKSRTRRRLRKLVQELDVANPDFVSAQLMLIVEGMCSSMPDHSPLTRAGSGPALARTVLQSSGAG
jgi:AcrR family transcriptional regulator